MRSTQHSHAHDVTVNPQGQPLTIKDPLNNIITFTYELGDLVSVKDPLNRETKRMLDAAGQLRSVINPLGQKTVYTTDALDRITLLTDTINGITQFGYDPNSNLLTVTRPESGSVTVLNIKRADWWRPASEIDRSSSPASPYRRSL